LEEGRLQADDDSSITKFLIIKKYYIAADAGTAAELQADPWTAFRPGIDKFNAKQRQFTETTPETVVDESMYTYAAPMPTALVTWAY
jgi:hypothetical protein